MLVELFSSFIRFFCSVLLLTYRPLLVLRSLFDDGSMVGRTGSIFNGEIPGGNLPMNKMTA